MLHLHDLTVLVLGLGSSGLAMARWCARHGAAVRVWDSRWEDGGTPPQAATLAADLPSAVRVAGPLGEAALDGVRLVLKSPGLAPADPRIAPLLAAAAEIGIAVQGELDLYARALADLKARVGYAPQVLAITGTNGKTTTTALTALLVERAGRRVATAGNIGPTLLDTLAQALDAEPGLAARLAQDEPAVDDETAQREAAAPPEDDAPPALPAPIVPADDDAPLTLAPPPPAAPVFEALPEVWVLELSSFQLDRVRGFEPSAGVVLNLTQDHLDWHCTMAAYAEAKSRVWGRDAVMVVNRDDALVEAEVARLLTPPAAPVVGRAKPKPARPPKPLARTIQRFGLNPPQQPGDWGLVTEGGMAWLVRAHPLDPTLAAGRRGKAVDVAPEDLHLQRLMPADALRIRGRHNAANALAALALATAIGCPLAPMLHGLREYRGEPHRVAFVATIDGVDAYDDSKGTNVGATVAAIEGLGLDRAPAKLVLLLGGDGKGQDFAPLAEPLRRHGRAAATIGRDAARIEAALADTGVPVERQPSLEAATAWAFTQARAGDAVLLSPACASLDMFRNYAHRAEVFVAAVQAHAEARGLAL